MAAETSISRSLARRLGVAVLSCAASVRGHAAPAAYVAVDVPSKLGGIVRSPNEIVSYRNGSYALEVALEPGVEINALELQPDGAWLFTSRTTVTISGITVRPSDVMRFDGAVYSKLFDGTTHGIPDGVAIDAVMTDAQGHPILSFDAPFNLSGTTLGMSDLVRFDGAATIVWDGDGAGVPAETNLTDAAQGPSGSLLLSFDIPTAIGSARYLPGDVVSWSAGSFALSSNDPSWPPETERAALSFSPRSGEVPGSGAEPLTICKSGASQLQLAWGASCSAADSDYEVYEGQLGDFASHVSRLCSTGGARAAVIAPGSTSSYYLIVPRNAVGEGFYGVGISGNQRPPASASCLPQSVALACTPLLMR